MENNNSKNYEIFCLNTEEIFVRDLINENKRTTEQKNRNKFVQLFYLIFLFCYWFLYYFFKNNV